MWNFSERASTSPTLEEMAQKFHDTLNELTILNPSIDNQSGQGVVTRNQAKQTQKKKPVCQVLRHQIFPLTKN